MVSINEVLTEILPAVVVPNIGGILGALLIAKDIKTWYNKLKKPSWSPPNWIFGPAWTTLYICMGISSWMIYKSGGGFGGKAGFPLVLYGTQLVLNWLWSPIFFKAHRPGVALVEIIVLWLNVAACISSFHPINKTAAHLLLPYLAWLSLATALNYSIWKNNPNASRIR
ncbi:putative Translocator protein [Hypsibius exemplaris]|uniref:Translocator protein n=1 Tax=Hypsibius exemplaris TaxID=2072580 RepID=A0A9X6NFQ2_HYPEX|nr:putative Translocator protein [Hypsibius exemplaris]